ncbi:phosphatase PAP2 family protein [Ramlibacter tataouinensis]|uniref:phosphatase PAP2 family protein n=1 Tax=Ramlibacter tataouinensis TaxID=94132 RepID=UPI0009ED7C4C|nr:phosphatase PAP2 family protein [Ramlibacter tataouinensis]
MQASTYRMAWVSAAAFAVLLSWDFSGLDVAMAQVAGGGGGFPLRDNWLLDTVLHDGAKYAAWLFELALCLMVFWPLGPLARIPFARRLQLAVSVVLGAGLITALKATSHTSCPWDLREFGGVARHLSHWTGWLKPDGGGGHCFPAGHASSGFAFLGGYFAFRHDEPRIARLWLLAALAAGLVFGFSQQLRGAHFMSHTLWTGWLCWMSAWLTDRLTGRAA